jgi:DNA-binding transcriptional LysR family regulator
MVNMDIRRLRSFVMVAETRHFGRAAERLHVAQPAITQQIQQLEKDLGVKLLERGPRKVSLTPVGEQFIVEARKALAQIERAALVAGQARRGEVGHIEISHVSSTAYSGVLSELLLDFGREAPEVTTGVHEADLEPQLEFLSEGRVDVAFVRLPAGPPLAGFKFTVLRRERVVACLRHDHPLVSTSVSVSALAQEPFLATHLREGWGFYDTQLRICRDAGFEPRIVNRSRQFATIVSMVSAGRGVALVPEPVRRLQLPDVVYVPIDNSRHFTEIAIAYRADNLSPAAERFISLCQGYAVR